MLAQTGNSSTRQPGTGPSISALDLSTIRRALDLARRGKADEATALEKSVAQPAGAKLIEWALLRGGTSEGKPFDRYAAFLRANAHWPSTGVLRRRAEEALWDQNIAADAVRQFFSESGPTSPKGQFALAKAYLRAGERDAAAELVRKAWREGSFSKAVEERALEEFGELLTEADHKTRLDMRLYENDNEAALSIARLLNQPDAVAKAWFAVNSKAGNARALLNALSAEQKKDARYIFANAQLLRRENKITAAAQLLLTAPRDPDLIRNPDAWWVLRRDVAREVLDLKDARKAYQLVSEAALPGKENFRAEYQFLSGWLALRHLQDAKSAVPHFAALAKADGPALVKARALYWLGRAAEAAGRNEEARAHYKAGAAFPLTYYGQLALARSGSVTMSLREPPAASRVAHSDLVRAVEILYALGERDLVVTMMADVADRTQDVGTLRALAELASRNEDPRALLQLGKDAVEHGLAFEHYAFPTAGMSAYVSSGSEPEPSIVYAIARQESGFNAKTVSSANAVGLMQVTPDTARGAAKKLNLAFDQKRLLEDPAYNVQIGAGELTDLIQYYRGSYILAFAAYNAGRGRVNQWIERYGDPRNTKTDPVDWIERIPFAETRDYVQRVLENVQVYRVRLGGRAEVMIDADLKRGVARN